MPVTKTAKRALRSSKRKGEVNKKILSNLEISIRMAKKSKKEKDILNAISLSDRARKKRSIHANKAARIKSSLAKLLPSQGKGVKAKKAEKSPKTKKASKKK